MQGNTKLLIETKMISEGQTSFAFKIYDTTRKLNMIGKIDKDVFYGNSEAD